MIKKGHVREGCRGRKQEGVKEGSTEGEMKGRRGEEIRVILLFRGKRTLRLKRRERERKDKRGRERVSKSGDELPLQLKWKRKAKRGN